MTFNNFYKSIATTTSLLLAISFTTPTYSEEAAAPLTDESAQEIFEQALEERDSGKIYSSIEKFEYILSR